jgi:hypothetical protein
MLYGLPKRSSKSYDRERCLSFDGHKARGSMTLTHGTGSYRIERSAVGTTKISETLSIICLDTGEQIKGEPHELFVGVPAEVFESSCAVGQMRAADISGSQAASAVENLMVSADESIDIKRVLDKIDKVRKEYKLNKGEGGLLHKTQVEISELTAKKRAATERYVRFNEQRARLERKESDLATTQAQLSENEAALEKINAAKTLERFDKLEASRKLLLFNKDELEGLEQSFRDIGYVPSEAHVFSLRAALDELGEAETRLNMAEKDYENAKGSGSNSSLAEIGRKIELGGGAQKLLAEVRAADKKSRSTAGGGIALALVGIGAAVTMAFMKSFITMLICGALAAAAVVVAAVCFAVSVGAKKKRDALCAEYGKSVGELEAYFEECLGQLYLMRSEEAALVAAKTRRDGAVENEENARKKLASLVVLTRGQKPDTVGELHDAAIAEIGKVELFCTRRDEINKQIYALRALCESEAEALAEYDEEALRALVGDTLPATDSASVAAAEKIVKFNKAKLAALSLEVSNLREAQAALSAGLYDDPVELGDRIAALEKKLDRDTQYFDALMLAKTSIEAAQASMSGNFTPEISRRAGEMLALVSGGKHLSAQANKSLDLNVEQDGFSVPVGVLSGGTRDVAYVCLRIALMIKLFGAELPPLMLDEAMCQLDDARAETMLSLVARLEKELGLQMLLFTCHTRESRMLASMDIKANTIRM